LEGPKWYAMGEGATEYGLRGERVVRYEIKCGIDSPGNSSNGYFKGVLKTTTY